MTPKHRAMLVNWAVPQLAGRRSTCIPILTKRRSNMNAVTPFILERTAAGTRATARLAQEQVELLKRQNEILEEILKIAMEKSEAEEVKS